MTDLRLAIQGIDFEWDTNKAIRNESKHGISFETACNAFFDPFLTAQDDEIISGEVRHTVIGMTTTWQLLYIVYVWRGDSIRLISARFTTTPERKNYENR